ncbi:MAG: ZIP family metal transporter [Crocinitomicaceae bacterium]|nr:ZIP family metal transporter [Crocinitomicaceae bacterium]MDG1776475.1 ZIP family metal transporter [Crocinitomicaceae bacterium]
MELILINISLVVSVLFGGMLVSFIQRSKNEQIIKLMLAFSGGFLLSIAFIHFIPELYEHADHNVGLYILIGFLVQLILEFFSGGIEHGHVHAHKGEAIPIALIAALSIHALLEGIPLGTQLGGVEIATSHHHGNDNSLLLGILFHRLPVAIALMTLLSISKATKLKSWSILGLFAITTPVGVYIGYNTSHIIDFDFDIILAIVVGMFLHISTTIIFETSENHKFNFLKLLTILGGCSLAFLMH